MKIGDNCYYLDYHCYFPWWFEEKLTKYYQIESGEVVSFDDKMVAIKNGKHIHFVEISKVFEKEKDLHDKLSK